MPFDPRIKCTYKEEDCWFHTWFQEGGFEPNNSFMIGGIDLGAVLEKKDGSIIKVFDIMEIKFKREAV